MLDLTADFNDQRHPANKQALAFSLTDRQQFQRGGYESHGRVVEKGRDAVLP